MSARPLQLIPILLFASLCSPGQTKSFDIYSYGPLPGYTEKPLANQVAFIKVDNQRRYFCQFALQQSQPTTGSAVGDLAAEWNLVVAKQYTIAGTPVDSAFSPVPGALIRMAPASTTGVPKMLASIVVLPFPGRYIGILFNTSDEQALNRCQPDLQSLATSIRLTAQSPAPTPANTPSRIQTGNVPTHLFAGMPGWLPSGNGLPVPDAGIVQGKPAGLWWDGGTLTLFLPSGIRATNPRLGGPRLYDYQGHRQQAGSTGVGDFQLENGQITQRYDGFVNRQPFSVGNERGVPVINIGGSRMRPVKAVSPRTLIGTWTTSGKVFIFREDGTFEYAFGASNAVGAVIATNKGRYILDGYLIQLMPDGAAGWIDVIGMAGDLLMKQGNTFSRK